MKDCRDKPDSGIGHRIRAWPVVGWLAAMIAVVGASSAMVMARTDAVSKASSELAEAAAQGPRVVVEQAQVASSQRQIALPATIVGYSETPVYAKITGYLKEIRVDKGDRVRAPFDAIVTARYVDPGVLIAQATTAEKSYLLSHMSETATPIVTLATLKPLRVYASVPQNVANFVHDGDPAAVTVEQYPGRIFDGHITRRTGALDPATRMMLVEVDLPNSESALYPGMFGTMAITVRESASAPLVPDDALIFRAGKVFVPVVRDSIVHLAPVTLGYDNGYAVEAAGGISGTDLIALNLGQSAIDGERVQPFQNKTR